VGQASRRCSRITAKPWRLDELEANSSPFRSTIELMADLANELQEIYDGEINVRISWFWDNGIFSLATEHSLERRLLHTTCNRGG